MEPSTRTCPNCAALLTSDARFCPSCGMSLSQATPPLQSASAPRRTGWLIAAAVVLLACLACVCLAVAAVVIFNVSSSTRSVLEPQLPSIIVETIVPEVEMPDAELLPTIVPATAAPDIVTPTAPAAATPPVETPAAADVQPPDGQMIFEDGGARFFYDPALATSITVEEVAANAGADVPPWDIFPAHVEIFLQDYPARDSMHTAQISIYPVEEYEALFPDANQPAGDLAQLLKTRPELVSDDQTLPFLPYWNAGQMIHAGGRYIDNETLSGIRYLTQYGQDVGPLSSDRLFYTFQGLTHDGKYYVAAVMPAAHHKIPNSSQITAGEYQALAENYDAYLAEARLLLDGLPDDSFKPGLDLLDALFESFEVGNKR